MAREPQQITGGMQSNDGLTLVETVIVLSLLSIMLLIAIPLFSPLAEHHEIALFFEQFESDVLHAQQVAITEAAVVEFIFVSNTRYTVNYRYPNALIYNRYVPEGVDIPGHFLIDWLSFNRNGNISQGGRMYFEYEKGTRSYTRTYIFTLGSGRFRIEESS